MAVRVPQPSAALDGAPPPTAVVLRPVLAALTPQRLVNLPAAAAAAAAPGGMAPRWARPHVDDALVVAPGGPGFTFPVSQLVDLETEDLGPMGLQVRVWDLHLFGHLGTEDLGPMGLQVCVWDLHLFGHLGTEDLGPMGLQVCVWDLHLFGHLGTEDLGPMGLQVCVCVCVCARAEICICLVAPAGPEPTCACCS